MADNALSILAGMQLAPNARQLLKNVDKELGQGIAAPFAVIGYKGGKWSIRHRGTTKQLTVQANGTTVPVPFLDLVILYAADHHSKIYYAKNYQEGDDDIPDCWSTDGIKPDQAVPKRQADICANCKWNEFGSRTNVATGAKGKACADTRRMAVVPSADIENTVNGGPMLLRVPPASLGVVGEYSDRLKANSFPYSALVTRLGFDLKEAYPKFTMEPVVALTVEEVARVAAMQAHPLVDRIVQAQLENVTAQVGSEQGVETQPKQQGVVGAGQKTDDGLGIPSNLRRAPNGSGAHAAQGGASAAASPASMNQTVSKSEPVPHGGNPFASGVGDGPSYPGQKQAAESQPAATSQPATQPAEAPPAAPFGATAADAAQALTPEQLRIKEMEAEIARLKAGGAEPKTRKTKRTQPVAPSAVAEPAQSLQSQLPGEPIVDDEETGEGDGTVTQPGSEDPALAAINARLSNVMNRQS